MAERRDDPPAPGRPALPPAGSIRPEEAAALVHAVPHSVAVLDEGGRVTFANEACVSLHGWPSPAAMAGRSWRELYDEAEGERLAREAFPEARAGRRWSGEARGLRRDGVHFPQEAALVSLGGGRLALVARDLTESRRAAERMAELVYRDALTGLPNRRLFEDRLAIALAQAHRYRHRVGVVFLDLDRFKQVNDALGHATGDELLRQVAGRLAASVREGDTVARLGGDEFTLLLPGIHYAEDLATVSRKLAAALREPVRVEGHDLRVTASGGVSLYPEDGEDVGSLLRAADTAMYRAKERGRDNFQMFSPAMAEKALERRALERSLDAALEREEMRLHYQPCLELASGRVVGVEALLRWNRPELGLLLPKDVIALAELTGAMREVGPWVLETACRQARAWSAKGAAGLRVMVNLSAFELRREELVADVERALDASGLPADRLHLEVPEGFAMRDVERASERLRALRSVGVHLAIDGFGSGLSSLAQLRRMPVDALKIDLSFVRGATSDPDDASVVTAVIAVAHSLGLKVVAQGVETESQLALLRSLGCDYAQGYLWSPPVPPEECARLLAAAVLPSRGRAGREAAAKPRVRRRG